MSMDKTSSKKFPTQSWACSVVMEECAAGVRGFQYCRPFRED